MQLQLELLHVPILRVHSSSTKLNRIQFIPHSIPFLLSRAFLISSGLRGKHFPGSPSGGTDECVLGNKSGEADAEAETVAEAEAAAEASPVPPHILQS